MEQQTALLLALGASILALVYGLFSTQWILGKSAGNERMQEIAGAIQEGASAYMNRQYTTIAIVGVVLFGVLAVFLPSIWTAIGFAIGAIFSGLPVMWACLSRFAPMCAQPKPQGRV